MHGVYPSTKGPGEYTPYAQINTPTHRMVRALRRETEAARAAPERPQGWKGAPKSVQTGEKTIGVDQ